MGTVKILKQILPSRCIVWLKRIKGKLRRFWQLKSVYRPEMRSYILPQHIDLKKNIDGEQYYSQFYQDLYLDRVIFKKKENGFFLDIGGNDPVFINNTYFFEKTRNWSGIAFEPMPKRNMKWGGRNTPCLQVALGARNQTVEFCEYIDDYMSGISDLVEYKGAVANKYTVQMRTLDDVLKQYNVTHIDFISLDVEGMEMEVLKGIDFDRVSIYCFVIENNKPARKANVLRNFLLRKGFHLEAKLWIDEVWINPDNIKT